MIEEGIDSFRGTKVANLLFKYAFIHSASVIEVNPKALEQEDRFNVKYKIYSQCSHSIMQEFMDLMNERITTLCENCKATVPSNKGLVLSKEYIEALLNEKKEIEA